MKKVVFIGGGAASITSAVYLKKREPSFDVTIVEKDKKIGRKLSLTGGGKCNIAPLKDDINVYNNPNLVESLFNEISLEKYLSLLEYIGFKTKTIKDYGYYPVHESAPQVVKNLYHQMNKLGIKIIQDEFVDYFGDNNKVIVKLKNQELEADYLILSTGGLSPLMKEVFNKHQIKTTKVLPGLCPLRVKEDVSSLFGCRFEANVALLYKDQLVKEYFGEVQFKKDGLSGIPTLNLSSEISRMMIKDNLSISVFKVRISLPKEVVGNLQNSTIEEACYMLFKEEYANYIIQKHHLNKKELMSKSVAEIISSECFSISSLYDFESAQVTVGGVSIDEIDKHFALKQNKKVYVIGEALDIDGICGGYNLRFAISSGFEAVKSIIK